MATKSSFLTIDELKARAQKGEPFDLPTGGTILIRKAMRGDMKAANEYSKQEDGETDFEKWTDYLVSAACVNPTVTPDEVGLVFDVTEQKAIMAESLKRGGLSSETTEEKKGASIEASETP